MHAWYIGILYVVVAVSIGAVGLTIVRRRYSGEILKSYNDAAGPIYGTIGVAFSILLAFVVTLVWGQFNDADKAVSTEADHIVAVHRYMATFPDSVRHDVDAALQGYLQSILQVEWKLMEEGKLAEYINPEYEALWRAVNHVNPESLGEQLRLQSILEGMNRVDDSRNERVLSIANGVPTAIWILLVAGAVVTILFPCFLGTDDQRLSLLMIGTLASMLAFTLFLIAAIDHPFAGVVRVDQDAYINAIPQLKR